MICLIFIMKQGDIYTKIVYNQFILNMRARCIKVLKVFEAFTGYGGQCIALKCCNIPHKIEGDVVLYYASTHENLLEQRKNELIQLQNGEIELARWFGSTSPT